MSRGQALITYAGPYMLAEKARALIATEVGKGCDGTVMPNPVALEPIWTPITLPKDIMTLKDSPSWADEAVPSTDDLVRYRVWISPEQPFDWDCCELFLRQLCMASNRIGLEISGNQDKIIISLLCYRQDIPVVTTAFYGKLKLCKLSPMNIDLFGDFEKVVLEDVRFYDFYPAPPYCHLLTRPNELHSSPFECLFAAMSNIPAEAAGFCQTLFQPVSPFNNWHRNTKILMDLEYMGNLRAPVGHIQRYANQGPSNELHRMAGQVETKAHNDKPFYAAALRVAVVGAEDLTREYLQSMAVFTSLFLHGGMHLLSITEQQYASILSRPQIHRMFELGLTHRPGFLVNSEELTGLIALPPANIVEHLDVSIDTLDTLADGAVNLSEGTPVGTCEIAGTNHRVCISPDNRKGHTHVIGKPGTGKSTVEEHMILDDINKGDGVVVLDPHGDLAERLLALIPKQYVEKVIYFDPGDLHWVPIWNPLQRIPGQDIGQTADNLMGVLKSFVSGWGDRLESILRNSIFAMLHFPGSTLMDIANLLRRKSNDSRTIYKLILDVVQNKEARQFWQHDFPDYTAADLAPPKHKLGKLLVGGTSSLMLSQPRSSFNFRRIMDEGMIFIANLSKLGTENRQILGGFIVATVHTTALSRTDTPKERRKPCHMHLDEAHKFVTDSLEDVIAETLKYGVHMTFAHQFLHQFNKKKIDAMSSVGTTIVFNVDTDDAAHLAKDFQGLVSRDDISGLEKWQAIMRCGTDIVRFKTLKPEPVPENNYKDQIIARSRELYCAPAPQVYQMLDLSGKQAQKLSRSFGAPVDDNDKPDENGDWSYDEY